MGEVVVVKRTVTHGLCGRAASVQSLELVDEGDIVEGVGRLPVVLVTRLAADGTGVEVGEGANEAYAYVGAAIVGGGRDASEVTHLAVEDLEGGET